MEDSTRAPFETALTFSTRDGGAMCSVALVAQKAHMGE
jgi:hypothetical protein